jgi:hypothetical protein
MWRLALMVWDRTEVRADYHLLRLVGDGVG